MCVNELKIKPIKLKLKKFMKSKMKDLKITFEENLKFLDEKFEKTFEKRRKTCGMRPNITPEIEVDIAHGVIIPIDSDLCLKWNSNLSLRGPIPTTSWHIDI